MESSYTNFGEAVLDVKRVSINLTAFQTIQGDDGRYVHTDVQNLVGQVLSFSPPDLEASLTLNVLRYDIPLENENMFTYSGKIEGDYYSSFTFFIDDEVVVGRVKHNGLIYLIEPNDALDGAVTLSVIQEALVPKDPEDYILDEEIDKEVKVVQNKSGSGGNVRVLVKYASNVTNAAAKSSILNTDLNTVLSNSLVSGGNYFSLAGIEMVADTFSTKCKQEILFDMRDSIGVFSNINNELISNGADIAILMLNGPAGRSCDYPYTGTVGGQALFYDSTNPFGVFADNYLSSTADYTGVHEIGHIMNGRHPDKPQTPNRGIENISDPSKKWQSMMGSYGGIGSSQCTFSGPIDYICERVPYFSNPALTFNSDSLGSSTRDMETHLESVIPVISNWRGNPVPIPSTPTGMNSISDSCYGFYDIDWNNTSGATSYKLFKSTNPSFTGATEIYSGTYSNSYVNVTSGTWYFRAQACNVSGCSANSSQVSATRLTYCM